MGLAGSGFVLTFAAAKEIMDPNLSGMAVSVVNTGCFIGTALMQPLFGFLADKTWDGTTVNNIRIYMEQDYKSGFLLMLIFAVLSIFGALRVRETFGCNQHNK
jgi:MFS family permease